MKKILLFFVFLPQIFLAQNITYDKTSPIMVQGLTKQTRLIGTDLKNVSSLKDKFKIAMSISASQEEDEDTTLYSLFIRLYTPIECHIERNSRILLKSEEDSITVLYAEAPASSTYEIDYNGKYTTHYYQTYISYNITEEQANYLQYGIKKIKIECSIPDNISKEWKSDKKGLGLYLYDQYKLIKARLNATNKENKKQNDSFLKDF